MACPSLPYFSTLSHKRHDFRKKKAMERKIYVLSLQLLSETFLILRITDRDSIIIVFTPSCEVPVMIVRF